MSRPALNSPTFWPEAIAPAESFHREVLDEVRAALAANRVVVIGMGWNPHVGRARKALDAAGVKYHYLGYGNYLSKWRERLAIKLWSGWATFPQVYVEGALVGGADEVIAALAAGRLKA